MRISLHEGDRERLSTPTLNAFVMHGRAIDEIHAWACEGLLHDGVWVRLENLLDDISLFNADEIHPAVREWRSYALGSVNLLRGGSVPKSIWDHWREPEEFGPYATLAPRADGRVWITRRRR